MESSSFDKKYQLDTNENRAFLRAMTENLLAFGRRFPSPGGGSYWLGDDGTPWKDRNRDTWNTEFTVCDKYRGLNANMHSVEAFLAVADATGNESYRVRAGRVIDHVIGWAKNNGWRTPEHYHEDWTPDLECNADRPDDQFKPYGATPGHGIEWARLIVQWAMSTYGTRAASDGETEAGEASGRAGMHIPAKAAPYIDAAEHLFNRAISDGWCADGEPGIVYTTDWNGKPVVHDRMHWTLAEAINTSAALFHVTGKPEYADWYAIFMKYLDEKVVDHVNGSWFHQMDAHNRVLDTVWPGKSDLYHATQATLIPYYPVTLSIASAVKRM